MSWMRSLSGRLLLLTALTVLVAEVLIFVPSVARHRVDYLYERLSAAAVAAVAILEGAPNPPEALMNTKLLQSAEVLSIAVRSDAYREPVLSGDSQGDMVETFFLDEENPFDKVSQSVRVLFSAPDNSVIRVIGSPPSAGRVVEGAIEITLQREQLRKSIVQFSNRVALLSLVISLLTAVAVYLSLTRLLVRPTRSLINNMIAFREAPEEAGIIKPDSAKTEIAEAQRELATMQTELRAALKQKTRLAGLGEGVAKINHDLRNILASAQLLADRLERSDDPLVVRTAPKLLRSLDRATALCQQTLDFGSASEPPPLRRRVMLAPLIEELSGTIIPLDSNNPVVRLDIERDVFAEADPDQLYRVLQNLMRNSVQAISVSGKGDLIEVSARRIEEGVEIDIRDNGPGMPKTARENLFTAFKGGARRGGSGLGLNIARELVRGHGGDIALIDSTTEGTLFRISLPDQA